jgi:hypothetical protein
MTYQHSRGRPIAALAIALLVLAGSIVAAQGNSSAQLRRYIDQQVLSGRRRPAVRWFRRSRC